MVGQMSADISFYCGLAQEAEADGELVELAVGGGRVAIPVAQATGRRVVGIDTSPAILEQARNQAEEAGVDLDLQLSDMRDLVPRPSSSIDLLSVPGATSSSYLGGSSNASLQLCDPEAGSRGMRLSSTIT
jgi:SAM-dependent methyltransferase